MFNFTGIVWFNGDSSTGKKKQNMVKQRLFIASHDEQNGDFVEGLSWKFGLCFIRSKRKFETIIMQLLGTVEASSTGTTRARYIQTFPCFVF